MEEDLESVKEGLNMRSKTIIISFLILSAVVSSSGCTMKDVYNVDEIQNVNSSVDCKLECYNFCKLVKPKNIIMCHPEGKSTFEDGRCLCECVC